MLGLHDSISSEIVAGYLNMVDVVSLAKPVRSSDIGCGVISDTFSHTSPPTEDTEDEHPNNLSRFQGHSLPFEPRGKSALGVKDIMIAPDFRHEEGIHMNSSE